MLPVITDYSVNILLTDHLNQHEGRMASQTVLRNGLVLGTLSLQSLGLGFMIRTESCLSFLHLSHQKLYIFITSCLWHVVASDIAGKFHHLGSPDEKWPLKKLWWHKMKMICLSVGCRTNVCPKLWLGAWCTKLPAWVSGPRFMLRVKIFSLAESPKTLSIARCLCHINSSAPLNIVHSFRIILFIFNIVFFVKFHFIVYSAYYTILHCLLMHLHVCPILK